MGIFNIIGGALMIAICAGIIISVLVQESKRGGGLEALSNANSYYSQNEGKTRESRLHKLTRALAAAFFIVAVLVSVVSIYLA